MAIYFGITLLLIGLTVSFGPGNNVVLLTLSLVTGQ